MRFSVFRLSLALLSIAVIASGAQAETVIEEQVLLPVVIDGRALHLDALIVRPAKPGRFPIALIANGSAGPNVQARDMRPDWIMSWAHDFAHRGWLAAIVAWRGYGRSDGPIVDDAGTCDTPNARRYLEGHADDLAAALELLSQRPDVENGPALGIGDSIGGLSMLALAARPNHRLDAVVNISGGLYHDAKPFAPDPVCASFEADVVGNLAQDGASFHGPTLWLYAENDPWFRPAWVARMRTAYVRAGGAADFIEFPPFGTDGHQMFSDIEGKGPLLQEIDGFLRRNGLPTWDDRRSAPLLSESIGAERDVVASYLQAKPTEKALVAPDRDGNLYWVSGWPTLEVAREKALDACRKGTGGPCHVVLEDFDQVAPLHQRATAN